MVVQDSLSVNHHHQFSRWLQGDLQHFLPHDVFMSAAGQLTSRRFEVDVFSVLPDVRVPGCADCRRNPISERVFERWLANERQMLAFEGSVDALINETCDCPMASRLRGMQSALVHGLRDERSGEDALYVIVNSDRDVDRRQRTMLALLLPQIDFACRRLASRRERGEAGPAMLPATLADIREEAGISSREQEILGWVRAGKTNYEIGQILNISAFTVKNHLQRIYRKIDVINRTQAVAKLDEYARGRCPD